MIHEHTFMNQWRMVHEQEGLIMYSRKIHDLVHELMMNDSCTLTDYVVHELFIRHSWLCFKEVMIVFFMNLKNVNDSKKKVKYSPFG